MNDSLIKPDTCHILGVVYPKDMPEKQIVPYSHVLSHVGLSWEKGYKGRLKGAKKGCPVFIIDTGGNPNHPDLHYTHGHSFTDEERDDIYPYRKVSWEDNLFGHGIHVAGIACALDNQIGIVGVAPEADLIAAKVFRQDYRHPSQSYTEGKWIARAIEWAADYSVEHYPEYGGGVINMSLGGPYRDRRIVSACNYALDRGCIIVCAAGNDGQPNGVDWPGAYHRNIAVGAITKELVKASYSDAGLEVDVAAPGTAYSTWLDHKYVVLDGTSMATPFVAGIAALAKGKYGDRCSQEYFMDMLNDGCSKLDKIHNDGQWRLINSPRIAMAANTDHRMGLDFEVVV